MSSRLLYRQTDRQTALSLSSFVAHFFSLTHTHQGAHCVRELFTDAVRSFFVRVAGGERQTNSASLMKKMNEKMKEEIN